MLRRVFDKFHVRDLVFQWVFNRFYIGVSLYDVHLICNITNYPSVTPTRKCATPGALSSRSSTWEFEWVRGPQKEDVPPTTSIVSFSGLQTSLLQLQPGIFCLRFWAYDSSVGFLALGVYLWMLSFGYLASNLELWIFSLLSLALDL